MLSADFHCYPTFMLQLFTYQIYGTFSSIKVTKSSGGGNFPWKTTNHPQAPAKLSQLRYIFCTSQTHLLHFQIYKDYKV